MEIGKFAHRSHSSSEECSNPITNEYMINYTNFNLRFAEVRNTLQGKLEERLPFFSFIFPESFKQRYSKEYAQFKVNLHRLATPFDVHETFLDLLREFSILQKNCELSSPIQTLNLPSLSRCSNQRWLTKEA